MNRRLFLASLATAAASVIAAALVVVAVHGPGTRPAILLILAGVITAIPVAAVVAAAFAAPLRRRAQALAATAARAAAGDVSRTAPDYGSDELGVTSRAFDAAIRTLEDRLTELSRDRARMEAILSGMVEGVLVVNRQGRLQLVNRAAYDMLGIGMAAEGRPYLEVIRHPDITALLASALGGVDEGSRELGLARDQARTFVARAAPVAQAGGGGAVLVLHDISDLRRADRIRRDFVANVSHELRTPLTAIRGYLEALLDDPADAANTRRFLEIAARHTTRMERLVTDLLRLTRLDARQEVLDVTRCDLRQMFEDVVADLQPAIAAKRQQIIIDVPPHAREVNADRTKLHDAIRNLVENAVNYSPEDTAVELTAGRNGAVLITVADHGPGIPNEDLTRVFERFYRVDKSRSRPGGTGLGLAIARHLVELHRGSVSASNRSTGGAVFTITLPDDAA